MVVEITVGSITDNRRLYLGAYGLLAPPPEDDKDAVVLVDAVSRQRMAFLTGDLAKLTVT